MVFSFMRRPHANLDLKVDGDRFSPGDTVEVEVAVGSHKGFEVRQGSVTIECIETYWQWETTHTGKTTSRRKRKRTQTIAETHADFMGEGAIPSGSIPRRHEVTLTLPADAPPSVVGKSANLRWQVKMSLDVPGARDVHKEQTVLVVPKPQPSAEDRTDRPVTAEDSFGDGTLRLELEGTGARAGEPLKGTLRLDTRDSCEFDEVRIELEREEEAGDTSSTVTADSAVLERDLAIAGMGRREWPFTLTVPDGVWPTVRVSRTLVRWRVKGILARKLRPDHRAEAEVAVR